jgi:hypothetical protein
VSTSGRAAGTSRSQSTPSRSSRGIEEPPGNDATDPPSALQAASAATSRPSGLTTAPAESEAATTTAPRSARKWAAWPPTAPNPLHRHPGTPKAQISCVLDRLGAGGQPQAGCADRIQRDPPSTAGRPTARPISSQIQPMQASSMPCPDPGCSRSGWRSPGRRTAPAAVGGPAHRRVGADAGLAAPRKGRPAAGSVSSTILAGPRSSHSSSHRASTIGTSSTGSPATPERPGHAPTSRIGCRPPHGQCQETRPHCDLRRRSSLHVHCGSRCRQRRQGDRSSRGQAASPGTPEAAAPGASADGPAWPGTVCPGRSGGSNGDLGRRRRLLVDGDPDLQDARLAGGVDILLAGPGRQARVRAKPPSRNSDRHRSLSSTCSVRRGAQLPGNDHPGGPRPAGAIGPVPSDPHRPRWWWR